jgi:hypothetical protein
VQIGFAQTNDYLDISKLVEAGTKSKAAAEYMSLIANAEKTLLKQLNGDTAKKTFFINVYNGFTNISLEKIQHSIKIEARSLSEQFTIAGTN